MLDLKKLRAVAGGLDNLTDEEIIQAAYPAFQQYYSKLDDFAKAVGYEGAGRSKTGSRVSAAVDSYQANMYGLAEAAGAGDWARQGRERNEAAADYAQAHAKQLGAIDSYKDIGGLRDAGDYLAGLAIQSAPYLVESLVGGGVGGLAARGLGYASKAALATGRTAGAVAASYPSSVGDILSNQREQNGTMDLLSAAAGGVPYAALNAFGLEGALARREGLNFVRGLDNASAWKRLGANAGISALSEGASETGQEVINQWGRNQVDPTAGYTSPEALSRYAESFVGGAALGGVGAGALGGWRKSDEWYEAQRKLAGTPSLPVDNKTPVDLLQIGHNGYFQQGEGQTPFVVFPDGSTATQSDAELMQRYGMTPDTLAGLRQPGPRVDPTMAAEGPAGVAPYLPGKIIADQGGQAALDAAGANSLYGQDEGDPGLAEARRRYLALVQGQNAPTTPAAPVVEKTPMQLEVEKHAAERAQLRQEATAALVAPETDGSTPKVKLGQREITTFATLKKARAEEKITDQQLVEYLGQMREALQANDSKALNDISKQVGATFAPAFSTSGKVANATATTPAAPINAQPNVPGTAQVAPGAAGQPSADASGSGGAVGRVPANAGGGVQGAAQAPVVSSPAPAPVGSSGGQPGAAAVAPKAGTLVDRIKANPTKVVLGNSVDFKALKLVLEQEDPRMHHAVRLTLGVDKDGNRLDKPLSNTEAADRAGLGATNRSQLSRVLSALGITKEVRNRWNASNAEANERAEGDIGQDGEDRVIQEDSTPRLSDETSDDTVDNELSPEKGFGRVSSPGGAQANIDSAKTGRLTAQSWYQIVRKKGIDKLTPAELGTVAGNAAHYEKSVDDRGAYNAIMIRAAELNKRGDPKAIQEFGNALVEAYQRGRNAAIGSTAEVADDELGSDGVDEDNGESGGADADVEGGDSERAVQSSEAPKPAKDSARPARQVKKGAFDGILKPEGRVEKSTDNERGGETHTKDSLVKALNAFMRRDVIGRKVVVVETASDLNSIVSKDVMSELVAAELEGKRPVAFAANGTAYFIADRVQVGREKGVFLHEVGGHLGLQKLLGGDFEWLVAKILKWHKYDDGSIEHRIAKAAFERAGLAKTQDDQINTELVAYFIEEAVHAGIDPTAANISGPLGTFLRKVFSAFKNALRKIGVRIDTMTAQDVVDLAYGAAQIASRGRYHGTAADVHQFRNKYMGTGEGAQAYGWGQYFSEMMGVARSYRDSDVRRKTGRANYQSIPYLKQDNTRPSLLKLAEKLRDPKLDAEAKAVLRRRDHYSATISQFLGVGSFLKFGMNYHEGFLRDALKVYDDALFSGNQDFTLANAVDRLIELSNSEPKGNLYSTDFAVEDDEWLQWDKPIKDQSPKVQAVLKKLIPLIVNDRARTEARIDARDTIQELYTDKMSRAIGREAVDVWFHQERNNQDPTPESVTKALLRPTFTSEEGLSFSGVDPDLVRSIVEDAVASAETNLDVSRSQLAKEYERSAPGGNIYQMLENVAKERNGPFEPDFALDDYIGELNDKYGTKTNKYGAITPAWEDSDLTKAEREKLKQLQDADRADRAVRDDERVSKYLDSLGVKGVKVPIDYSRGGSGRKGHNFVVFNDKNILRTFNNPEEYIEDGVQFSMEAAKTLTKVPATKDIEDAVQSLPTAVRPAARLVANVLRRPYNALINNAAFTETLLDRAAKLGMKAAKAYKDLSMRRSAVVGENQRRVLNIVSMYGKLSDNLKGVGKGTVNDYLYQSTRHEKWGYQPSWLSKQVEVDPEMAKAFEALGAEGQAFVDAAFKMNNETLAAKKDLVIRVTTSEYDALIAHAEGDEKAKLEKEKADALKKFGSLMSISGELPYAPMRRFGSFVVLAESPEYAAARESNNTEAMRTLEKTDNHYYVDFVENDLQGQALKAELEATGKYASVVYRKREDLRDKLYGGSKTLHALTQLRARADMMEGGSEIEKKAQRKFRELLTDMYLLQLAEDSARKSEMKRRGVAGNLDMIRSLETQGLADANFMGSLEFNQPLMESINAMRRESREGQDQITQSELLDEVIKRHVQSLDYAPKPIAEALSGTTSLWMLATSPAYYLQNLTQPWMMSLPVMAGRHDWGKSAGVLNQAYSSIGGLFAAFKKPFTQYDFDELLSNDNSDMTADEKKMLLDMLKTGRIDIGMATEVGQTHAKADVGLTKPMRDVVSKLRNMQLKMESVNRLSTALAAYRLELAKTGDQAKAAEYANSVIQETHGDYSGWNAPRAFNTSWGKVGLQFRKYQLIQITMLARLIKDSFGNLPPTEKAIARRSLAYALGHSFVIGGGKALPIPAALAWVFAKAFGETGDEPPEYVLRKMIGDKDVADLLINGVPAAFLGFGSGSTLGFGNTFSVLPFTDIVLDDRKGWHETAYALLSGPLGGLANKAVDGIAALHRGDLYRGFENLAPKGVANALKSFRTATEGVQQKDGDQLLSADEFTFWDTAQQALGFTPQKQVDRMFRQDAAYKIEQSVKDTSAELKTDYTKAVKAGEPTGPIVQKWNEYQATRERMGFKRQPISELFAAAREQGKRETKTVNGVQYKTGNERFAKELADM